MFIFLGNVYHINKSVQSFPDQNTMGLCSYIKEKNTFVIWPITYDKGLLTQQQKSQLRDKFFKFN